MNSRWLAYSLLLVGLVMLGYACKGGGGDAFITVVRTSPEDGATDVQVDTRVGFQITTNIDPDTLTSDNFFLTDSQGTPIAGTLAIDPEEPDVAVLTPDDSLSVISQFTATITTGLASTGGATLEQDFVWRFTTLDSEWGTSEWLEEVGTGSSAGQELAVDGQSNALAVWEYEDATETRVWANHYTRVALWEEPVIIDGGSGQSTNPKVAADGVGNGFAVWRESEDGVAGNIWTNRYDVEQGAWGVAELLQNGEVTPAQSPAIAADSAGNAIAIWFQEDMFTADVVVWSNRYVAGVGWGSAAPIDDMPTPSAGLVTAVGVDANGDVIAIWTRPTFMGGVIWANRYTSSGWGVPELIKDDGMTEANGVRLDVGANGDAFVIWVQPEGDRNDVWSTRFSGSTWSPPERIDDHTGDTDEPDIAVDGMGVAHAVWSQRDLAFRNIWANQYAPGSGWGTPELIEPPNPVPTEDADATVPRVEANSAGNVFVVWRQTFDDWGSIWSNRLDPEDAGWTPERAQLIEQITRAANSPNIVVDENRHAHAAWLHNIDRGVDWVRTNRFE